jgi:hypothetical protein
MAGACPAKRRRKKISGQALVTEAGYQWLHLDRLRLLRRIRLARNQETRVLAGACPAKDF